MGEQLCQPLCILHYFNNCQHLYLYLCLCFLQANMQEGRRRPDLHFNCFCISKIWKSSTSFLRSILVSQKLSPKTHILQNIQSIVPFKKPHFHWVRKVRQIESCMGGHWRLPVACRLLGSQPPISRTWVRSSGQQHCEPPLPQCCVMLYSWLAWSSAASFGQTWVESPYSAQLHSCLWSPPQIGALLRVWHNCHRHFEE